MRAAALRRPALAAIAVLASMLTCSAAALADWAPTQAGQLNTAGSSVDAVAAAAVQGVPYVAWVETDADKTQQGLVAKLSGSAFTLVGAPIACSEFSHPSIAEVNGEPYVACVHLGALDVYAFNGSAWEQVGQSIKVGGNAYTGIAEAGGVPYVAYVAEGIEEQVAVAHLSSGSWVSAPALPAQHGEFPETLSLLSDDSHPILAWWEETSEGSVYADQLSGGSWTQLNGAHALGPAGAQSFAPTLALVGSTPYLALQSGSPGELDEEALQLTGTTFAQVGGAAAALPAGLVPAALGAFEGAPLLVSANELTNGENQLQAMSFTGGTWSRLGGALGVPPLPSPNGTAYAAEAFAQSGAGVPYVAFLEQQPGNESGAENLFVEDYTGAGIDPNKPFQGAEYAPTIVTQEEGSPPPSSAGPGSTPTFAPAASLDLLGSPSFKRRGRSIELSTGVLAVCPPASAKPPCRGVVALTLRPVAGAAARDGAKRPAGGATRLSVNVSIPSGAEQPVSVSLPAASVKRLGAGRPLRGTMTVTITGPNGKSSSLAQPLATRLP